MADRIKVLIIDDHPLFREGLKSIIERSDKFDVVDEAGNGEEGLKKAKKYKPDLLVIDISMPDISGIELTRKIRPLLPDAGVMIVSMHSKIDYMAEAFQAGARGYVIKESASERLIDGLEMVAKGEYFLDSSVSIEVIKKLMEMPIKEVKISDSAYSSLTPREQEILRLLAEGLSNKEAASRLYISPKTVENHRTSIMKKLNLQSTYELVRYAIKLGLIDLDL